FLFFRDFFEIRSKRQQLKFYNASDPGCLEDVAEILREPVGDIDGRARYAEQFHAKLYARLRLVEPFRRRRNLRVLEAMRRAAELAGAPDVVSGMSATAPQGAAGRDFAEDCDAHRKRAARRIAAYKVDTEARRERVEAFRKRGEPGLVGRGQRERERRPARG